MRLEYTPPAGGGSAAPSYAGSRQNSYDPRLNAYNWKASNTRRLRAAIGHAMGGNSLAHLAVVGDSMSSDAVGGTNFDHTHMWSPTMRDHLAVLGVPSGGTGIVCTGQEPKNSALAACDPRYTFTGTCANNGGYVTGYAGASMTFSDPNQTGTAVDVYYHGYSGTFTVSIDGGAAVTVNGPQTPTIERYTVTGLTAGTHTVAISVTSDSYIMGVNVYGDSGILLHNLANYGSSAQQWATQTDETLAQPSRILMAASVPVDVLFLALGGNDMLQSISISDTQGYIRTIKNKSAFANADTVLLIEPQPQDIATWPAWASACYDLADEFDCPLVDLFDRFGTTTEMNSHNLIGGDNTHVNKAGQRDWGRMMGTLLAG